MPTRPELVADAAVTVLARDGLRSLTHRAVDAEAALPAGSTSNCFRSRTALLEAVVDRLEELDRAAITAGPPPDPTSMPALAAYLSGNVRLMTSRRHVRTTRARLVLLLDETAGPAMEEGHRRFLGMLEAMLAQGGHPTPGPTARAVSDLLDGALMHAASVRSRTIDVAELSAAVERLLA
ncbi:TetR/AcrR family transcriptional regulator [Nocardioides sp. SLBN-35]|uniref:TetR/AcrR family transcriptional regulator n=1 Tax=Nocardioides sp. SLBN-35 TaxID=2768445 RepID=UPI0011548265|nr:TetR/AcrR family transcriptional regulator [Nocardioides sp. SLBN-35]TQK70130.1 TetR family transcriptional regulator [Nocardioides sp. SLBN-35]